MAAPTLVATVGSSTANSYVTVADCTTYLNARLNASAWTTAVTADEGDAERALIEATRDISILAFRGYRTTATQALSWPRQYAEDPDAPVGTCYFASDVVPQRVKDQTCELALEFLRAGTTDIASADATASVIRKKVDVLETEYANPTQRAQGIARFPRILQSLAPLLASGVGQVRLTR